MTERKELGSIGILVYLLGVDQNRKIGNRALAGASVLVDHEGENGSEEDMKKIDRFWSPTKPREEP